MPNIASAKKRVRTTAKRTAINTARKTRVRGFIRKVEEAIAKGDKKAAAGRPEGGGAGNHARRLQGRPAQEYRQPESFAPDQAGRKTVKVTNPLKSLAEFKSR